MPYNDIKNRTVQVKLSHVILSSIVLLFLLFIFSLRSKSINPTDYSKQKQTIDSLNNMVLDLKKEQIIFDKALKSHQYKISLINYRIDSTKQEITNIRNYYGKKIRDINKYTPSELNRFFSSRYK